MKKIILLCLGVFSMAASAQYDYKDSNMIGITGGLNQMTMMTDGFEAKGGTGWNAGLSVRGNFFNNWDIVYAMQFSEYNFSVATTNTIGIPDDTDYTMSGGQVTLQFSYKIVPRHFSVEIGPAFHFQGELAYDRDKKGNLIAGTPLTVEQLRDISKFNFSPVVGLTAGFLKFRVNVSYQYGMLNTFERVNKSHGSHITGHPGVLNGNIVLYL
ncbi:outer membrane beta-barrel protein [Flavobacterium pallidum]|uniref:Outer membrane protein beta-barrel domain-containing protein n=1 Tax=Flavobacterium pallidum TaxID=2172098 RepID=A0A2S1SFG3_9FLAO|nr:outer membrane beta-barrel protein [Flavobacterium pallidum]AWI25102.1 hypothetical protein HYN49_03880 [Flavobacterium pallidum]